jgi:regulatory protein
VRALKNKITKIEIQKKNKNRVNVYVDGEYNFSCNAQIVFSHNLKSGNTIDPYKIKDVAEEDDFISCKNYALNIIDRNLKTEKEMDEKLKKREYSEKIIKRVFIFLKEYNLINDVNYSNLYIRDKIKKQGKVKIGYDLLRRGITKEIIDESLQNIDDSAEIEAAEILAKKKYESIIKTEREYCKIYSKLKSYMLRVGFRSNVVNEILKKTLKDIENTEENFTNENHNKDVNNKDLKIIAEKRYNIIRKSENDDRKIHRKLWEYLLRRGYSKDEIKNELNYIQENNR